MYKLKPLQASTSHVWAEAAVVLALLGDILSMFALIGTEWSVRHDATLSEIRTLGLWHRCSLMPDSALHKNVTHCTNLTQGLDCLAGVHYLLGGWHVGCQILFTLGIAVSLVALVVLIIFQCCATYRQNRAILMAFIVVQVLGAIFMMSAAILYSHNYNTGYPECGHFRLDWSFHVAATSTSILFVAGAVAGVQFCCFPLGGGETIRLHNESESSSERPSGFDNVNVVQMELPPGVSMS